MPRFVEYLGDEQLDLGQVTEQDKKKLLVTDVRGRITRLAPDKVLFAHHGESAQSLAQKLDELTGEVDVQLLWESLLSEPPAAMEAPQLAQIYFDCDDDLHASAVFRALLGGGRELFRRKGKSFEARSADDLDRLQQQRTTEQRSTEELQGLIAALQQTPDPDLCQRIERHLRHGSDRQLASAMERVFKHPEREAFELLLHTGHMPPTADLELIQANLQEHPAPVVAHAASLELPPPAEPPLSCAFSIDDPDTREVDDALSAREEDGLVRVDVDIADVSALVRTGDPVDQEAQRRATTVYLPTRIYRMLPERLGCDLLSLQAGQPRPTMRTTAWIDEEGQVQRYQITHHHVTVERRLDYDGADELLARGTNPTAQMLRLLQQTASRMAARRRAAGALFFQQREFKIQVSPDAEEITVKPIPPNSPSRALVAEMMILANSLAARFARERGIPIIFRVQPPPAEKPPDVEPGDPAAFSKLRGLLQPAALSLNPARHFGLGLEAYTQASSPLRRYTDLVIQRQIHAGLAGEAPPYTAEGLFKVLGTAEATERDSKRLENSVTSHWALEYVARLPDRRSLKAWVLDAVAGGYKVELCCCGAVGLLLDTARREPGELVTVKVKTIRPRQGAMRMVPTG